MKFNLCSLLLAAGIVSAKKYCIVSKNKDGNDVAINDNKPILDLPNVNDIQFTSEEPVDINPTEVLDSEEDSDFDYETTCCIDDGTCKDNNDLVAQCENKLNGIEFIKDDNGNLKIIKIITDKASAEVYIFGATLTSWIVEGEERIFLSNKSLLDGSGPIRGGIPLVFPQFKSDLTEELPFHGFARISNWRIDSIDYSSSNKKEVSFVLTNNEIKEDYLKIWPHQFELVYTVTLEGKSLSTNIKIKNTGDDKFEFNTLIHTYYHVNDLSASSVYGLMNYSYIDTTPEGNYTVKVQENESVPIVKETDYIYFDVDQDTFKLQTGFKNNITVKKTNFQDCIIYNPWINKSRTLEDLGEENYPHMMCFEVGRVTKPIELEAGAVYEGGQLITVE